MGYTIPSGPLRFSLDIQGNALLFEVCRADGLYLMDWLGLGRPLFGAISTRLLLPRCRRRLWPEFDTDRLVPCAGTRLHTEATLRELVSRLTASIEAHPDALVFFG
jgi:hypothetical protein